MTNQQNVTEIDNFESCLKNMSTIREEMRSAINELAKDEFLTGYVLLEHPLTKIHTATPSRQDLSNCILFSDENTEKQIVIQLNSTNAVIKYLIPLLIAARMLKKMMETSEGDFSPYEIGLIDKLLEMEQRLIEKDVLSIPSEEVAENLLPNEAEEVNDKKREA